MKCINCEDPAEYVLNGNSLCGDCFDVKVEDEVESYNWPERIKQKKGYYDKI